MMESMTVQSPTAVEDKVCLLPSFLSNQPSSPGRSWLTRSQDTSKHFPFLLLPAEIRNKIYRYALVEDSSADRIKGLAQPPLTRTNKQIRSEALPIYYGQNRFRLDIPAPSHDEHPDDWPNFIRMFRAFKGGRSGGRGTGSLRFICDIQCRLCKTTRYDCWKMWVTFGAASGRRTDVVECQEVQGGHRMAEITMVHFWHDLESIRDFFGSELLHCEKLPGRGMHEEYLNRLVSSVLMVASECIELTKGVVGCVWAAIDRDWRQNGWFGMM